MIQSAKIELLTVGFLVTIETTGSDTHTAGVVRTAVADLEEAYQLITEADDSE